MKLAKLWERSKDAAVAYHSSYYAEKFRDDADKKLVGVYIDITGNKEIYKRPEMVHLPQRLQKWFHKSDSRRQGPILQQIPVISVFC